MRRMRHHDEDCDVEGGRSFRAGSRYTRLRVMTGSSVSFDPSRRNSKLLLYVISAGHPRGIRRDAPLVPGDNYALAATGREFPRNHKPSSQPSTSHGPCMSHLATVPPRGKTTSLARFKCHPRFDKSATLQLDGVPEMGFVSFASHLNKVYRILKPGKAAVYARHLGGEEAWMMTGPGSAWIRYGGSGAMWIGSALESRSG